MTDNILHYKCKPMREKLTQIFLEKNQQLNLSAIRDSEGVRLKHIQDSLMLLETKIIQPGMLVIDVGTGGGFPLMPLALSYPETKFLGIDSVRKKTLAVNEMLGQLWAHNAEVIRTRMEEYQGEKADVITARAVAYSDKLIQRAFPLLKHGGYFLLMKQFIEEERSVLLALCKKYHMDLIEERQYSLFDGDIQRVIYSIRKR